MQMRNQNSPIAVEGFPFIGGAAIITLIFLLLSWKIPAVAGLLITLFIAFFFRNPERKTPEEENAVIAPADGVVIYVGNAVEQHSGEEMLKISIFMSVFNVHVNRSPLAARIVDSFYRKGKFLDVRHERATFENEQQGLVMETGQGKRIVVVQVAGLIARRIVCYAGPGDALSRGERYGLIRFGSRLDVYLPGGTELKAGLGTVTRAGETILGYLN